MLKIENFEVVGWEHAIRGMRNPMNSWEKSDSECLFHALPNYSYDDPKAEEYTRYLDDYNLNLKLGPNDYALMKKLRNAGTDHRKFMRMITVYLDITAPQFWWYEFDTYHVGTVKNSCSKMHKIHAYPFTIDNFTHEGCDEVSLATNVLNQVVEACDILRERFNNTKDKKYWRALIEILPSAYNMKASVMLNYEVLANIYDSRKDHRLDEWHTFCHWIEELPYSELITGYEEE